MGKTTLNVKKIQHLKEPGLHPDGTVPGLYLKVATGGSKAFVLRTMVQGKRRDIGLGGTANISLAEVRDTARAYRAIARNGGNPLAERDKSPVPTFAEAATQVHTKYIIPSTKNAKHRQQWINTLQDYAFPVIGALPVDTITSAEILRVLTPIWTEKAETARRVRQRLHRVFAWSRQAGH